MLVPAVPGHKKVAFNRCTKHFKHVEQNEIRTNVFKLPSLYYSSQKQPTENQGPFCWLHSLLAQLHNFFWQRPRHLKKICCCHTVIYNADNLTVLQLSCTHPQTKKVYLNFPYTLKVIKISCLMSLWASPRTRKAATAFQLR